MSILIGKSISYNYPLSSVNVFENLEFSISNCSRIGLIGKNGSGKTTLLKIINNIILDYSGKVSTHSNFVSGYLPQNIEYALDENIEGFLWSFSTLFKNLHSEIKLLEKLDTEASLARLGFVYADFQEKGGFEIELRISRLLEQFGFTDYDLKQMFNTLSGGEKTKLALIRVLLLKPDLLLLDEPTNHLDLETLEWIEKYLKDAKLPFIVISHDRKFLNNCVNTIWELKNCEICEYTGNYSFYEEAVSQKHISQLEDYKQKSNTVYKLISAAEKQRNVANTMENFKPKRSVGNNGKICQKDVGSIRAVRSKNKQKAATIMENRLRVKQDDLAKSKPFIEKNYGISFRDSKVKSRFVLKVEGLSKTFSDRTIFENLDFGILRGSKIAIVGKNGSGKTTLMKILNGDVLADEGSISWSPNVTIGYYSQEFECLQKTSTIIDEVIQGNFDEQTRARIILGSLGITKDKVNQKIKTLSEGEKSKTLLARLLFEQPDVLLLDEPTNHLEIDARKMLEDALNGFNGTILLVSHDRLFLENATNDTINL